MLNETWKAKRSSVTQFQAISWIIYKLGMKNGALGGKLLDWCSRFLFILFTKNKREIFLNSFKKFTCIPFKFEQEGSTIIFNDKRN